MDQLHRNRTASRGRPMIGSEPQSPSGLLRSEPIMQSIPIIYRPNTLHRICYRTKYVFCELSAGGSTANPVVYKNNTILGTGASTKTFYLDSGFSHIIQNNTGITESTIQNLLTSGSASVTALATTDI